MVAYGASEDNDLFDRPEALYLRRDLAMREPMFPAPATAKVVDVDMLFISRELVFVEEGDEETS